MIPTIMDEDEREMMWSGRYSYRDLLYADRSATPVDKRLAWQLTNEVVVEPEAPEWESGDAWDELERVLVPGWTERGEHVRRVYKVLELK